MNKTALRLTRSNVLLVLAPAAVVTALSIPGRLALGVDPFGPIGFLIASIFGVLIGIVVAAINTAIRPPLSGQLKESSADFKAVNDLLNKEMKEHKQSEELLKQSQKMEGIGRLAGGVAHDMNNILAAIMSIASTMEMDLESGKRPIRIDDVNDILEACGRGRDLTLSLLGFARKGNYAKKPMSLGIAIGEVEKLLRRVIPKTITIEMYVDKDLRQIEGDPSQIKNVLMNLGINAIDAMDGVGILTFYARNVEADKGDDSTPSEDSVEIKVVDTGSGMDDETIEHIFDPFYTTKPEGKGTGIGLSRVYGTVRDHRGVVTVKSSLGSGTTMGIVFPALSLTEQDPSEFISVIPKAASAPRKLLLVDDEPLLRKSGKRILEQIGYEVSLAQDGKQAVEIFSDRGNKIDIIVLDMIMPVMGGEEAFERIRKIDGNIPILICSGYSLEDTANRLLKKKNVDFVQKPFRPGLFTEKLDSLLSNAQNQASS
jgi:signal transduction histidine kinase/ActR/RegA family two-component response regulator